MTGAHQPARTAEAFRLRLHDAVVGVECDDAGLARNLLRLLVHFGFEPVDGEDLETTTLAVRTTGPRIEIPRETPLVERFGPVEVLRAEASLWVRDEHAVARIEPLTGRSEIRLDANAWRGPNPFAERRITLAMLAVMVPLRRRGMFGIHGAGVARDGDGCLLVARGGSGKSTLALHLALRGWDHLADDSFLVRPGRDRAEALSLRKHVYLAEEAAEQLPALGEQWEECPLKATPKRCLDLEKLPGVNTTRRCVPRWIIFPRLDRNGSRATRFERLDSPETLSRLVAHSELLGLEPELAPRQLETLRELALQCSCWELDAGPELAADPDRTATLFDHRLRIG